MIKKIKWNSNNTLGELELNFSKENGSAYNTIILAGENGTGKTTILDSLSTFLNLGSIEDFRYIDYIAAGQYYHIEPIEESARYGFHTRLTGDAEAPRMIRTNRNNMPDRIESDLADLRHYGFSYSKARSGFNTKAVKSTTTQQIDSNKYESDSNDDFTTIKQLLVDIATQDNAEWMRITKSGESTTFDDFRERSKMSRFVKAFNAFFETIKFKDVDASPEEIKILFEKHGRTIPVDNLSTGEKQIVFRGAHLLKNATSMQGGIVLIDEPELSMHPKWQQKVLQYYRGLFEENGKQTAQIIVATHSEYVIRAALEDRENVLIIALQDNNGQIEAQNIIAPTVLPSITSAETNYVAFGIVSIDYHIELYGYLQNKTGNDTVKKCDEYIAKQASYNPAIHEKSSFFIKNGHQTEYCTLPTYIRNAIDHPDSGRTFTEEELNNSIKLLIELCQ